MQIQDLYFYQIALTNPSLLYSLSVFSYPHISCICNSVFVLGVYLVFSKFSFLILPVACTCCSNISIICLEFCGYCSFFFIHCYNYKKIYIIFFFKRICIYRLCIFSYIGIYRYLHIYV